MQYDAKKVNIIVDGVVLVGLASDFVSCERNTEKRTQTVGAHGEVTTNKIADDTGKITVTLKSTSASIPWLITKYRQDRKFKVAVVDANFTGDASNIGSDCSIENLPTDERGGEETEQEWVILCDNYEMLRV